MDSILLVILIIWSFTMIIGCFALKFTIMPYFDRKNDLREMEIKNDTYKLYMRLDPKAIDTEINDFLSKYVREYIVNKFMVKQINFIRSDEANIMSRDITKLVMIDISDLYIFYIKMIESISDDDDLIAYVNRRVKRIVIEEVSHYNSIK